MKYKLINKTNNQENICEKVIVDGYDYYLGEEIELMMSNLKMGELYIEHTQINPNRYSLFQRTDDEDTIENSWKIIATTNPNIDIPKVVDEDTRVIVMAQQYALDKCQDNMSALTKVKLAVEYGYDKSQETHPFNLDDIKKAIEDFHKMNMAYLTGKEDDNLNIEDFIQLWNSQRIKTLYYG